MNEQKPQENGNEGQQSALVSLIGTAWRHKKKGGLYRVTQTDGRDNVYLSAETKGCRSTWKYNGLLKWDYEQVLNIKRSEPPAEKL